MSDTVRPWVTDQERRADAEAEHVRRAALAIGVVTHPLVVAIAAATGVLLARQSKIRPLIYVPAAAAVLLVVLLAGQLPAYYRPIVELASAIMSDPTNSRAAVADQLADHWLTWLVAGLPYAAGVGVMVGSIWAAWRSRRRATWRDTDEADTEANPATVTKALGKLDLWPAVVPTIASARTAAGGPLPGTEAWLRDVRHQVVRFGVSMYGRTQPVEVTIRELGYHGLVVGPTGFGKTTLLQELAAGLVEAPAMQTHRNPLVMVNMKPDPDLARTLASMAKAAGRGFHYVTHDASGGGTPYNPLVAGTPYQIASGIMEAEAHSADGGFSEAHYRRAGERFARFAARALDQLNRADPDRWPREYATLARLLSVTTLGDESDRFDPDLAADWGRFVKEMDANREIAKWIGGIGMRVAAAAEGGARAVLRDTPESLNLAAAIHAGDVVLFDLDAAEDAGAARLVGNLAIQDLTFSLARLGGAQWQWHLDPAGHPLRDDRDEKIQARHCQIIVDEFGALGGSVLYNLFQRVRGYGGGVILAAQDTGSLDAAGDWFRTTVINNSNVMATFAQSTEAEFFAGLVGTRKALEESHQIFEDGTWLTQNVYRSGQGNLREVEQYVVHPNVLRNLGTGQAIVRVRTRPGQPPTKVAVRRTAEGRHSGFPWPPVGEDDQLTTMQRQALAVAPAREHATLRADMLAHHDRDSHAAATVEDTQTGSADKPTEQEPRPTAQESDSDEATEPAGTDNPWIAAADDDKTESTDTAAHEAAPVSEKAARPRVAPRPPTRAPAVRDRDRPTTPPEPRSTRRRPRPLVAATKTAPTPTATAAAPTLDPTSTDDDPWQDHDDQDWPPEHEPDTDAAPDEWPPD